MEVLGLDVSSTGNRALQPDEHDDLALDVDAFEFVEAGALLADPVADENDRPAQGIAESGKTLIIDDRPEGMRPDRHALPDLEAQSARCFDCLHEWEFLKIGVLERLLGSLGLAKHLHHAERSRRHIADRLELGEPEQGRGVFGGRLEAARASFPAFHKVGGDEREHGQRILGCNEVEARLHLFGYRSRFLDLDHVLHQILGLRLGGLGRCAQYQGQHGAEEGNLFMGFSFFLIILPLCIRGPERVDHLDEHQSAGDEDPEGSTLVSASVKETADGE